jgi:hypothetical protein
MEGVRAPVQYPSRVRVDSVVMERARNGLAEFGLMVALFMMYFTTRGIAAGKEAVAFANAHSVMNLERRLGLFREMGLQAWVLTEPAVARLLNFVYAYTHMTALITFAAWVFIFHNDRYQAIRNVFLTILGSGLTVYILYPLAPPRLFPYTGFVDTLSLYSGINYEDQSVAMLYNPFAAMPSLHVAFALFTGIGLIWVGRRAIHWVLGISYPILMATAVVGTANHYILDAIAGSLLTVAAYLIVPRLTAWVTHRVQTRRDARQVFG